MNNSWIRFAGLAGVVVFLFGAIGGLVAGFLNPLVLVHIVLGAGLIVAWVVGYGVSNVGTARDVVSGRTSRFVSLAVVYTLLFAAILVFANYLASKHDKRWDLTEQGVYSIAEQSKNIIAGLKLPLKIVVFKVPSGPDQERIKDLLDLYKSANPSKFDYEIVDPQAKPHLIEKYGMKSGNPVYIEYGDKDPKAITRIAEFTEEGITNAVLKLAKGQEKKVYYVQGHGEGDIKSNKPEGYQHFATAVTDEHMLIEPLILGQSSSVPGDAAAVILNAPRKPLLPQEKEMLIQYADNGGRLLITYDQQSPSRDVKDMAAHFGVKIGTDVIVDLVQRLFAGPALGVSPILNLNGTHKILEKFSEADLAVFGMTSSVRVDESNADAKKNCQEFLKTGKNSWAETNLALLFDQSNPSASKDEGDITGPVSVGVVCEKTVEKAKSEEGAAGFDKVSRAVIAGNADWFANASIRNYSATDLALNIVNWLAGEEGGISIRPKQMRASAEPVQKSLFINIFVGSYIIPEIILLAGLLVWWRRRSLK